MWRNRTRTNYPAIALPLMTTARPGKKHASNSSYCTRRKEYQSHDNQQNEASGIDVIRNANFGPEPGRKLIYQFIEKSFVHSWRKNGLFRFRLPTGSDPGAS